MVGSRECLRNNYPFPLKQFSEGDRHKFIHFIRSDQASDCVAICRSNQYTHLTGKLDAEVLDSLRKSLKHVCNIGSGVDSIDVEACKIRGIQVSNTPALAAEAVAETVIFLIFGALRRVAVPLRTARKGQWQDDCPTGTLMSNKTIGLVGSGETASAVASRALAFGMKVQYCTRTESSPSLPGCTRIDFAELLRSSDIISLHVPLSPETRHILSKAEFEVMKPGVTIINTARGGVVDNQALLDAVREEKVWGVGLDVYDEEPHIPAEVREDERFFILPHVATKTHEIRGAMERVMIENLKAGVLRDGCDGVLQNPV
ncbi:Putative 2-hydroxyacid dehydrogenase [Fulvia fulva]|uniref:2-hydroxyacid dehydrogenase n=1 Tax=Passalora fulva TaxID=5499 RepID=A0A9Q8LJ46_PASFU|nr:Putative 2-hydroxyacid dehydrogenase [Fulvia fulva]KAK4624491.1 putative 2-hydroxyacid dehydrogenase [Fulvia fulva]KAK4625328.1 putative 2-hydroxyacid dehydrogenase [Fulvia fulva]UJO18342.1 Putative 2-hydroxyacid dehydrogenase [Fulvia fulva]WPV14649.1 Putative 2-hydroxyacid dehydrogenase [Fulvia fulva]WPV30407.1 Putative 2-hydroxyacid dehydrogenase [Fulvia fulva]